MLPFFSPMVVRDGFGRIVDGAMNPLNYLLPFAAGASGGATTGTLAGVRATDTVNHRSLNLDFFEGVEERAIDLRRRPQRVHSETGSTNQRIGIGLKAIGWIAEAQVWRAGKVQLVPTVWVFHHEGL